MRTSLILLPLLASSAPALSQTAAPAPRAAPDVEMQQRLADPTLPDRLARAMQVLSKSFMNLPVGEMQAALDGRAPTPAEKKMTVRDLGRRDDPNFERNLQQQVANARPVLEQSMKALAASLPALMKSLEAAGQSLERATANMPDPTYPKR